MEVVFELVHGVRGDVRIGLQPGEEPVAHGGDRRRVDVADRLAQGDGFEKLAHLIEAAETLAVQRDDDPALALVLVEDAEALKPRQHVPRDRAPDLVVPREFELVDAEAPEHRAMDDRALDLLVDALPGKGAAERLARLVNGEHFGNELDATVRSAAAAGEIAPPLEALDEAAVEELRQRLAHRSAARAEELGEAPLEQDRAARQPAGLDRAAQNALEAQVQRLSGADGRAVSPPAAYLPARQRKPQNGYCGRKPIMLRLPCQQGRERHRADTRRADVRREGQ